MASNSLHSNTQNHEKQKLIIDKLKEMQIMADFVLGNTPEEKATLEILKNQLKDTLSLLERENHQPSHFDENVDKAIKIVETIYVTVGNFDEIKDRILPLLSLRNKLDAK